MVDNTPNGDGPNPELPRGEPWVPNRRGLADRVAALPRGPALAGLAVAAGACALLLLSRPDSRRVPELLTSLRPRREARGFWVGILASTSRTVATALARRLAEDLLEYRRRHREGTRCP